MGASNSCLQDVIPAHNLSFPSTTCHSRAQPVIPAQAGIPRPLTYVRGSDIDCHSRESVSFPRRRESSDRLLTCTARILTVIPASLCHSRVGGKQRPLTYVRGSEKLQLHISYNPSGMS